MTQYIYQLNQQDQPFTTRTVADNEALLLKAETGRQWEVVPYAEGFALRAKVPTALSALETPKRPPPAASPQNKASRAGILGGKMKSDRAITAAEYPREFRPSWLSELPHLCSIALLFFPGVALFLAPNFMERLLPVSAEYLRGAGAWLLTLATLQFAYVTLQKIFYFNYKITDDGIESTEGILKKDVCPVAYHAIQTINVHRPLLLRVLGLGTIEISTSGGDGPELLLHRIKNPIALKDFLTKQVSARS